MAVIFEIDELKKEAQALKDILHKYKDQNQEAKGCLKLLDPIIQKVFDGKITRPVSWGDIPCGYSFHEGSLREIPRMDNAYYNFKMHITGRVTDEDLKFLDEMLKEIEEEENSTK